MIHPRQDFIAYDTHQIGIWCNWLYFSKILQSIRARMSHYHKKILTTYYYSGHLSKGEIGHNPYAGTSPHSSCSDPTTSLHPQYLTCFQILLRKSNNNTQLYIISYLKKVYDITVHQIKLKWQYKIKYYVSLDQSALHYNAPE